MSCAVAIVRLVAVKAIAYVCVVESHVSPAIANATHDSLTWLLSIIVPA